MLVVPVDGHLLGLLAGVGVDAVVRDVGNDDQFFLAGRTFVGLDAVVLVVEQLFFFGQHEQHGALRRAIGVFDRRVLHHLFAHWAAAQIANLACPGLGIAQVAVRAGR